MATLIGMQAQMSANQMSRKLGPVAKKRLMKLAADEAKQIVSAGTVRLHDLPGRVRPGFLTSTEGPLIDEIQHASGRCLDTINRTATPRKNVDLPVEVAEKSPLSVEVKVPAKFQRRLPPVSVAGKQIALETVIRDKIMQRGQVWSARSVSCAPPSAPPKLDPSSTRDNNVCAHRRAEHTSFARLSQSSTGTKYSCWVHTP
jgi:hypothetical protein